VIDTSLSDPSALSDLSTYEATFAQCCAVTQQWFELDSDELMLRSGAPEISRRRLMALAQQALLRAKIDPAMFAGAVGQPLKWSHYLAPFVCQATGMRAHPTLGQLWSCSARVFGLSWPQLHTLVTQGVHGQSVAQAGLKGLNWHAWITLDNGQIVDPTLLTTLAHYVPSVFGEFSGSVLCGSECELLANHRYFPMLAGTAAMSQLQSKSTVPILAAELDDLRRHAVILLPRDREPS
jgi:hypothetical protein